MRKVMLVMSAVIVLVLIFAITISVQAGPPEAAAGTWLYTPHIESVRVTGCTTHYNSTEVSEWLDGTFVGTSIEIGRVTVHCAGNWSFKAMVYFDEVEVNGRSGTLEMAVNGSRPDASAEWFGHWTITDGGGDLENLRGQGTFWGPGAPGPDEQGPIYYAGKVHFEPN